MATNSVMAAAPPGQGADRWRSAEAKGRHSPSILAKQQDYPPGEEAVATRLEPLEIAFRFEEHDETVEVHDLEKVPDFVAGTHEHEGGAQP